MDLSRLPSGLNVDLNTLLVTVGSFLVAYALLCLPVSLLARKMGRPFLAGFLLAVFLSAVVSTLIVWLIGPRKQGGHTPVAPEAA
jgi:hypothetical protein